MASSSLPTQYELYASGEMQCGLEVQNEEFTLNGKVIQLYSGSLHYFRIHPNYWRDRLRKLRACGLVAVTTYVPWNSHEPIEGEFDFGKTENSFSAFLDIARFLEIAKQEDLFVILRPGPYICSEWDFGGLPSWLLRVPNIKLRTSELEYMKRVKNYFDRLLPLVKPLQFTLGGPIIGFQIENEYGAYGISHDRQYLTLLKNIMIDHEIQEFFFTSDNFFDDNFQPIPIHKEGSVSGALMTINFQSSPEHWLSELKNFQPKLPVMVMEYWTGWLDHWLEKKDEEHNPPEVFRKTLEIILSFPAHVNFYMFHGGTNFGFMNGANQNTPENYSPDVSSYDYEAPLKENGDYTEKYWIAKDLINKYIKSKTRLPTPPSESPILKEFSEGGKILITEEINFENIIQQVNENEWIQSEELLSMEDLNINKTNGQSYGFLLYRKEGLNFEKNAELKINGYVHDVAFALVDNQLQTKPLETMDDLDQFGYWKKKDRALSLEPTKDGNHTLDILVENMGRVNYGNYLNQQKKGLCDNSVFLNGEELKNWTHIPLQFHSNWLSKLTGWRPVTIKENTSPGLYRAKFFLSSNDGDIFVDMSGWTKGVIFINGFNLGRYWNVGPQRTVYLPGPLLQKGKNEIFVFEIFKASTSISFQNHPVLK